MEEEEGGIRLSKRFSDKGGEVDYKTTSGTAWSHSYLNQKPWHPLSYPNQRRKWIAEQTHAQRQRRNEDVAREYAQEQEFLRQTSLLSQKEKEKVDIMQAVSFMYVRPPGYNAESAKAAEVADDRKKIGESDPAAASSSSVPQQAVPVKEDKKKTRPKDVFGRTLPTEEEFAVLKNAPKLETGVAGRAKPFAVEVRNVKCVRCGTFGHQSGDRECPLKDAIMPNDENRLKRDDPLTAIIAHIDSNEPLKWELKQKPGVSPPRGGFMPDDPNQQIVAEDIFDEYGGFLSGGGIPDLLANFPSKHKKKKSKSKSKHKKQASSRRSSEDSYSTSDGDDGWKISNTNLKSKSKHKKQASSRRSPEDGYSTSDGDDGQKLKTKSKHKKQALLRYSDEENGTSSESDERRRRSRRKEQLHKSKKKKVSSHSRMSDDSESERYQGEKQALPTHNDVDYVSTSDIDGHRRRSRRKEKSYKNKKINDPSESSLSEDSDTGKHHRKSRQKYSCHSQHLESSKHRNHGSSRQRESRVTHDCSSSDGEKMARREEKLHTSHKKTHGDSGCSSSENSEYERHRDRRRYKRSYSSENPDSDDRYGSRRHRQPRHH